MNQCRIRVSEFTTTPGARYPKDGPFSGQKFREQYLEMHFKNENEDYPIEVNLDGTEGYATSFLEEAFGGLARKFSKDKVTARLTFISEEDPLLVAEILEYIKGA